jgi:predicted transcriptional regulator
MNPVRRKQVLRTMLEVLKMASPYAVEEQAMMRMVNDLLRPPLHFGERGPSITQLRDQKFIIQVEDSLDKELRQFALTDLGKTFLATL